MKKVLVVDDEALNLKLVLRVLGRAGFEVFAARSAEEGLELLRTTPVDVILMDMSLEGINGLEATRRIKADPVLAHIPVLMVSAYAMEEDMERAKEAGCSGYITKPFQMKAFVETVRHVVDG